MRLMLLVILVRNAGFNLSVLIATKIETIVVPVAFLLHYYLSNIQYSLFYRL